MVDNINRLAKVTLSGNNEIESMVAELAALSDEEARRLLDESPFTDGTFRTLSVFIPSENEPEAVPALLSSGSDTLLLNNLSPAIGEPIVLRFCNQHEKEVFEAIHDAEHSNALQERYQEEHTDFSFEKMKAEYAYNPDAFVDAPEDSFPDERFAPETLIFKEERPSGNERGIRSIIDEVV